MKSFVAVALAALATSATAAHHRHAHAHLFKKNAADNGTDVCVPTCTTIYTTYIGESTLIWKTTSTSYQTVTVHAPTPTPVAPTPIKQTCPTPGTYTFPATTVTVTDTTTVCGASSTSVPAGTHTVGGVTTVVVTATTVTCPIATVTTKDDVVTSTIIMATHVCPSAGTYTISAITTHVTDSTVIVYPVPTSFHPGTYTAPEQVVTVTKTDYTTYCPFTSKGAQSTSVPAPPKSQAPSPTKSQAPPPPPKETPKETKAAPKETPKQTPKETPKAQPSQSSSSSHKISGNGLSTSGDLLGITYSNFNPGDGNCRSASDVDSDIAKIKKAGFSIVRVYGTDCSTLENVGAACAKYGLNIVLGVFVKGSCSANSPDISKQIQDIKNFKYMDSVKLIVAGNEAVQNRLCSVSELKTLVETVRSSCSSVYKGPITCAETLNIWQEPEMKNTMCSTVDIVGANMHAFFNPNTEAKDAGSFLASEMKILEGICNKDVINLETGWPGNGQANGLAVPGKSEKEQAIKSIREKVGGKSFLFSPFNDKWKKPGAFDCEQSWGVLEVLGM